MAEANLISGILLSINGPGQRRSICKVYLNTFKVRHNNVLLWVLSSWQFGLDVNRWNTGIYSSQSHRHFHPPLFRTASPSRFNPEPLRSWIIRRDPFTKFLLSAPSAPNCDSLFAKCHFVCTTVLFKSSFEGVHRQKQKSCMLLCSHHSQPSL